MPAPISTIPLDILAPPPAYTPSAHHPPSYTPLPSVLYLGPSIYSDPNPHVRAALREFQLTQDPENWGKRSARPRRRRQQLDEIDVEGGWRGWALYLVRLMAPEIPRGPGPAGVAFAMPPYGM